MKKIISLVILTALFFSCQKDSSVVNDYNTSNDPAKPIFKISAVHPIICEQWKIGSFILNGKEISSELEGYSFNFCSSNVVFAVGENISIQGTWYYIEENENPIFSMLFEARGIETPISLLNEVWQVLDMNSTYMRLNISDAGRINKEVCFKKVF